MPRATYAPPTPRNITAGSPRAAPLSAAFPPAKPPQSGITSAPSLLKQPHGTHATGAPYGSFGSTLGAEIEAPTVHLLNQILLEAAERGASDLHFEHGVFDWRIRVRVDGVLHLLSPPPSHLRDALIARIKALGGMDIAERRLPQDGRLSLKLRADHTEEFRVSTLPTVHGEKVVLRRLDRLPDDLGLTSLGLDASQCKQIDAALHAPDGMLLVTGPTGSGKTRSLFCFLQAINDPSINISTVEDPVEIRLPGINQVSVREKAGLGFARILRSFLRQDPDVLLIGEIRDAETADIAVKAAQTGHPLHTNDAPSTIVRLRDIGIAPYKLAASLSMITAQRLIRRLCPDCRIRDTLNRNGWRPVGCKTCRGVGYRGRIGVHQVMPISDPLRDLIVTGASAAELQKQARREGMCTLAQAAMRYSASGETSIEEVRQTTGCTGESDSAR